MAQFACRPSQMKKGWTLGIQYFLMGLRGSESQKVIQKRMHTMKMLIRKYNAQSSHISPLIPFACFREDQFPQTERPFGLSYYDLLTGIWAVFLDECTV